MKPGNIQTDPLWKIALWQQFGASIDMLENALLACPDEHWRAHLWRDQQEPESSAFWYLAYHSLYWLDLYLTGSVEGFVPPAPFTLEQIDPAQPYTRDEIHTYLIYLRQKCQATIAELSDEKAHRQVTFSWMQDHPMSFFELQLYNMRHVQEHATQLNLFLGQNAINGASDWVPQAQTAESGA